jgi:hypothetical protein
MPGKAFSSIRRHGTPSTCSPGTACGTFRSSLTRHSLISSASTAGRSTSGAGFKELTSGEIHVCSEPAELRGSRQAVQALREAPTFLAGDIPSNGEAHRRPSAAGVLPGGGVAIDRRDPVSPRNACRPAELEKAEC